MIETKDRIFYLTACTNCGVAVSHARVPDDPEWANAKAFCPECSADRRPVPSDDGASSNGMPKNLSEPERVPVG